MNKIFFAAIFSLATLNAVAQHDHSSHQKPNEPAKADSTKTATVSEDSQKKLARLLAAYYNLKNALVVGDVNAAASNANEFLTTVNAIDYKVISEGNSHILANDAGKIATTTDIKKQRDYFINLSSNMVEVAKALKLTNVPVYVQYCPMKKASWLSSEKEIRNPYYGNEMLTCGEVRQTL
jgi:hypothetical protein